MRACHDGSEHLSSKSRRWFFALIPIVVWAVLEATSAVALRLRGDPVRTSLPDPDRRILERMVAGDVMYHVLDPTLGWAIRPDSEAWSYRSNPQGLRGGRLYASAPLAGVLRVAAFGDSFTHGDDVTNAETWEEHLERIERPGAPVEVLNFGVGAYGPDQAFLRYLVERRRFEDLAGSVIVLGSTSENINRVVNVYRPFYFYYPGGLSLTKPRFRIEHNHLILQENPLPTRSHYQRLLDNPQEELTRIGENDHFFRSRTPRPGLAWLPSLRLLALAMEANEIVVDGRYNTKSEAYRILTKIVEAEVWQSESVPVVILFPDQTDLNRLRRGEDSVYAPLLEHLKRRKCHVLDMGDSLAVAPYPTRELVPGHYSPLANALVATALAQFLQQRGIDSPNGVTQACHRREVSLDGVWLFRRDASNQGLRDGWAQPGFTGGFSAIPVPRSWEAAGQGDFDGVGWYRRTLSIPAEWPERLSRSTGSTTSSRCLSTAQRWRASVVPTTVSGRSGPWLG